MRIVVMAEMAPAKTFIPIIKELDAEIIVLTHGPGVKELLVNTAAKYIPLVKVEVRVSKKRSNSKIASLVIEDIWNVIRLLRGKR